ncbi:MAG: Rossmann-like domain-containing protein [Saccharofermentanales bacterium]
MRDPWAVYDALIEGVDPTRTVDYFAPGALWSQVWSGPDTGVAMGLRGQGPRRMYPTPHDGMSLKDMARMVKSWNMFEASLGAAALNCYYNTIDRVDRMDGFGGFDVKRGQIPPRRFRELNAFIAFQEEIEGKNVVVIGHFPHLEQRFADRCNMTILERNPRKGDLPDPACEYIMRDQDYAFITGTTIINKTLPRLLELAGDHCKVSMVGPSTCMAPILFDYGVDNLSGYCVQDRDIVDQAVRLGSMSILFDGGYMASADRS